MKNCIQLHFHAYMQMVRATYYCFVIFTCMILMLSAGCTKYEPELHALRVGAFAEQIYKVISIVNKEQVDEAGKVYWPRNCTTSTGFFNKAMEEGLLPGVTPNLFISRSMRQSTNETLGAQENIWCITMGLDETSDKDIPFMFTHNVEFARDSSSTSSLYRLSEMTGLSKEVMPFGKKLCVVVTWGGERRIILRKEANQKTFNPAGADNVVLFP